VQRLEVPAPRDKLGLPASRAARGGWGLAQSAKIAGGADQAATRSDTARPVDDHASRKELSGRLSQRPGPTAARSIGAPPELARSRAGDGSSTEGNPGSIGSLLPVAGNPGRRRLRPDVGHREHRFRRDRPHGIRNA